MGFCHGRNAQGNHDANDGGDSDSDVKVDVNGYCPFVGAPGPSLSNAQQTDLEAHLLTLRSCTHSDPPDHLVFLCCVGSQVVFIPNLFTLGS